MTALSSDAWISLTVTISVVGVIQFRRGAPVDLLFLAGLVVVTLTGVISPTDAVSGFRSTAVPSSNAWATRPSHSATQRPSFRWRRSVRLHFAFTRYPVAELVNGFGFADRRKS